MYVSGLVNTKSEDLLERGAEVRWVDMPMEMYSSENVFLHLNEIMQMFLIVG